MATYAYLDKFKISKYLVTNAEYLDFIKDNGYGNFKFCFQMDLSG